MEPTQQERIKELKDSAIAIAALHENLDSENKRHEAAMFEYLGDLRLQATYLHRSVNALAKMKDVVLHIPAEESATMKTPKKQTTPKRVK